MRSDVYERIGLRGGGFVAEVKRSKGCLLWEVTRVNRNELPSRVVAWLRETVPLGKPAPGER